MAWSIFTQGGGSGAALTWARDLLAKIGAPQTPGNQQFVYDWETSEGGGGKYNPLNQGPVPGQPGLTSTGQQYGGGAADFVSWQAGLQGASDYLHMPAYAGVLSGLKANDPAGARTALWDSGWAASHYGYGSRWSNAPVPGHAAVLTGSGGPPPDPNGDWFLNPVLGSIIHVTNRWERDALKASGAWVPYATRADAQAVEGQLGVGGSAPVRKAAGQGLAAVLGSFPFTKYLIEGAVIAGAAGLVVWGVARATGAGKAAATVIETTEKAAPLAAAAAA